MDDFDERAVCGGELLELGMLGSTAFAMCRACGAVNQGGGLGAGPSTALRYARDDNEWKRSG